VLPQEGSQLAATGKAIHDWHDSIQQDRVGLAMLIGG